MGKELTLREHQMVMLDILKDFASFCEEHNLRYFLDAGTLLGAVRHKGFIPWDNDADVCIPRPDFDIFYELLKQNNYKLNDHLILEIPENTIYTFFKIGDTRTKLIEFPNDNPIECYVYIDVFIKDGLPSDLKKAKRICDKSGRLALWHWFYKYSLIKWPKGKNLIKKIIAIVVRPFIKNKNRAYFKQRDYIKKINDKYPYESCEYVTTLSNGEYYRMCKKSNFDDCVMMDFEGAKFRVPSGYNDWLTVLYGKDYMTIPPKENQVVHVIEVSKR